MSFILRTYLCAFVFITALTSLNAKEVYWPNQFDQYPEVDLEKSYESDNFFIVWGDILGEDPLTGPGNLTFDPVDVTEQLEFLYDLYINEWEWLDGTVGNLSQYKFIIVMNDTWETAPWTGWAFGGDYDGVIGAMWIHPQSAGPSSTVIAHELGHSMQAQTLIEFPDNGFADGLSGFFWEKHANYVASRAYPDDLGAAVKMRHFTGGHYHFNSTRKHYDSFTLLQYFEDQYGLDINFQVWREALRNQAENPLMTYKRILDMNQDQFGDLMGDYAQKALFFDFLGADGDLMRNHTWNGGLDLQYQARKFTYLEPLEAPNNYKVLDAMSPQDYGVNTVQLDVSDVALNDNNICIEFYGNENTPAGGVSYRFSFLATPDNGETIRYGNVFSAQAEEEIAASFEVFPDEKVYLVVVAVPDVHHAYEWEVGYPKIYRYPWQIQMQGAVPYVDHHEGIAGAPHENGGGFVATTASVDASVYVGPNAAVLGNSVLTDNVSIEDQAIVCSSNLSDNVTIKDAGLALFSSATEDVLVDESAALWWQTNAGTPHFGGDNEQYNGCNTGYYRQVGNPGVPGNGRENCDGLLTHPANDDLNPSFPIYTFAQPLACINCDENGGDADGDTICADVDCDDNDVDILGPGFACDDADPHTENDVLGEDCVCAGTPIVYDCPSIFANFGDSCDDGNPDTSNDVIGDDCLCAGSDNILNLTYEVVMEPRSTYTPNTVIIDGTAISNMFGLTTAEIAAELGNSITYYAVEPDGTLNPNSTANYPGHWFNIDGYTSFWNTPQSYVYSEININAMTYNVGQFPNILVGGEMIQIQQALIYINDMNETITVNIITNITITCPEDADGDGVCDSDDLCPDFDDNLIGTACDDGDACTTGETYDVNCGCSGGVFQDADEDGVCDADDLCPNSPEPGQACDDGDAATIDDTVNPNCECVGTPVNDCSELDFNDAESGWGIWNDGGADAAKTNNAAFANSGTYSFLIKDNTNTSVITTDDMDLSDALELSINFNYFPIGFNNSSQDFWLQLSTDGGATFTTVDSWVHTIDFTNNNREFVSTIVYGPFSPNTQLRFRCDATANNDKIYIDDINIESCDASSASCDDGIQNGDETEVDCGGLDCSPCEGCFNQEFNDFEISLGDWVDGGVDARRNTLDQAFANSGIFCVRLQDDTDESTITTGNIDMSGYDFVSINFSFITSSMENGEGFLAQYSIDGGATFTDFGSWTLDTDFANNVRGDAIADATGSFTSTTQFRIRGNGNNNSDRVYIDDIKIDGCYSIPGAAPQSSTNRTIANQLAFDLRPNPVSGSDNLSIDITTQAISVQMTVYDMYGQLITNEKISHAQFENYQLSLGNLSEGAYLIRIGNDQSYEVKRFIVTK